MTSILVDGVQVNREEAPASADELSHVLRSAHASGTSVIPIGGATKLHIGNIPQRAQLAVRTSHIRGIVEYEPDNMTVSVRSGTTLQELQDCLKTGRQFLPLDPPWPQAASIGGLVACNSSGAIRFRYGTIRDLLIGVKIVHADGTPTKAGGKLVKNVSGYDMCKLYTGSLGTLGILTELTFKVQPLSEDLATILVTFPSLAAALEATQTLLKSELLPDALEAWNPSAASRITNVAAPTVDGWLLMVRFGEVAPAVQWQIERLKEVIPATGGKIVAHLEREESERLWSEAASARENESHGGVILVKCSVLYQSAADVGKAMQEIGDRLQARTDIFCHAGNCTLYARYEIQDPATASSEGIRLALTDLRRKCVAGSGHAVVERAGAEVKNGFDVWGYEAPALDIMRRIKNEFDPKRLLNPGRFVGGI